MFLDEFHFAEGERVCISAEQASRFAREIAGDFNPIHDPCARRFCVPGDLLFALVLSRYGLSQRMTFRFCGMVGNRLSLSFVEDAEGNVSVVDDAGKQYLSVTREGWTLRDPATVETFTRRYVAFSGRNFPHYLKPLLEEKGVMFNPQRPLVIYDSMGFSLEDHDPCDLELDFAGAELDVKGKRGEAMLEFRMGCHGRHVGVGTKKLVISGLQDYDAEKMDTFVTSFAQLKAANPCSA
ncbi:DUF3581 family protein [Salinicola rhizosphaerae]|uniref:DUF3581 family protein n=1 Tax=Salinicola rhizosphaerae TaxID=1443141 RepID=A0ABQ3DZV6_9GAMM|nr:DUF3581 family protein [Salinicola rhizosphaerae]GHB21668.1 hypothetical protein GCM10009038_20670 [Salinicola rhizosphaerae]